MSAPSLTKTTLKIQCPTCQGDVTLGLVASEPAVAWALATDSLKTLKARLIVALEKSSLPADEKRAMIESLAPEGAVVDPETFTAALEQLRTKYPPAGGQWADKAQQPTTEYSLPTGEPVPKEYVVAPQPKKMRTGKAHGKKKS